MQLPGVPAGAGDASAGRDEHRTVHGGVGAHAGAHQLPHRRGGADAQNRAILGEVVRTAQSRTDIRRVRVEGHTDTCGSEVGNMALSQTRAEAVAAALVELGVPRELLETVGFGSTQPRANEECEQRRQEELSRQTNRRVEFSILVCREGAAM